MNKLYYYTVKVKRSFESCSYCNATLNTINIMFDSNIFKSGTLPNQSAEQYCKKTLNFEDFEYTPVVKDMINRIYSFGSI